MNDNHFRKETYEEQCKREWINNIILFIGFGLISWLWFATH